MRIRTIKPEFWSNEKMAGIPDYARLLAIGLLNYADDHGYFWANPLMIRGALFPFVEDSSNVLRGLEYLSLIGYIRLGVTTDGREAGHVVKFSVHQRVDKAQASKIEPLVSFQERSTIDPRTFDDRSALDRKGKEGKGKDIRGDDPPQVSPKEKPTPKSAETIFPLLLDTPAFRAAWADWLQHRREKKKAVTPLSEKSALISLESMGEDRAIAAIKNSIEQGYTGIFEKGNSNGSAPKAMGYPPDEAALERRKMF